MLICYINLARRTDRRAMIEAELQRLGLAAERIEATTPDQLDAADIARYCDPKRRFYVTPEELACSASHFACLRRLLASDDTHALILEDDVLLGSRLGALLAAFEATPPPVDLLRLETDAVPARLDPRHSGTLDAIALHRYYYWAVGCAAYIVSREAASRILDMPTLRQWPIDIIFSPYSSIGRQFRAVQAVPALAIQRDRLTDSGIERMRESDLHAKVIARFRQLAENRWRRISYTLVDIVERDIVVGAQKVVRQYAMGARKRTVPFERDPPVPKL